LLQQAVAGHFIPARDNSLLAEYRVVLSRLKFGLSQAAIRELLSAFSQAGFRKGLVPSLMLPDCNDLPFVAVALATQDRTIITGNPGHYPVSVIKPVKLLPPQEELESLLNRRKTK